MVDALFDIGVSGRSVFSFFRFDAEIFDRIAEVEVGGSTVDRLVDDLPTSARTVAAIHA